MHEANRNTELISIADQILKQTELHGVDSLDLLYTSSMKISGTMEKYILNEHLIAKSKDLIDQYERKAKYEKMIIVCLLVVYFVIALNIVKERLLW